MTQQIPKPERPLFGLSTYSDGTTCLHVLMTEAGVEQLRSGRIATYDLAPYGIGLVIALSQHASHEAAYQAMEKYAHSCGEPLHDFRKAQDDDERH